ncbi:MAG: MaoC/PaaZ C-terminal domain-containing protein [Pseudomonadota bacterium]|nr:MaoC/PaaZ C-terminal domain-containing protein [Pseudomonadota bacterium]
MTATNCLTASMLEVGMRHEARLRFTREQVAQYCTLSGDMNAIHRDVEAARLRFPDVEDIVVPGGLIQISVTGIFGTRFPGDGCLGLTFTPERFRKPICPGEEIVVTIEVRKIRSGIVEVDVFITDGQGTRLTTAKSKLLAPDDSYRQWWETQKG